MLAKGPLLICSISYYKATSLGPTHDVVSVQFLWSWDTREHLTLLSYFPPDKPGSE